jgi:TIR domain
MKVLVSYCHRQGDWVRDALVPVLRASGADVRVDWERLRPGYALIGEMDATQDQADCHVLAISTDYLASKYCVHEMDRAIRLDPGFAKGKIIPVKLDGAPLPAKITKLIYVDLRNDQADDQWRLLIKQCGDELGMAAPAWLAALDKTRRHLERNECVNVVVAGDVDWRAWLDELRKSRFPKLAMVDLEHPAAVPRNGLIGEILRAAGRSRAVLAPPDDLPELARGLEAAGRSYIALKHFHRVADRPHYGADLFSSLRYLVMDARQLVLLAQTRQPVATLLPPGHELSKIDFKTVELG